MQKYRIIGSREYSEIPKLRINWIRGRDKFYWDKTTHHIACGLRDSGKSALGEAIACHYPQIIDAFGSRDNEGLAWCRSGIDDILLIVAENCDLNASWDVCRINQLTFKKLNDYEIVITVPSFFSNQGAYLKGINSLTTLFYKRFTFKKPAMILIREAANFSGQIQVGHFLHIKRGQSVQEGKQLMRY